MRAIRLALEERCSKHRDSSKLLQLHIRTVDSFQGSECDVILLTLVRSNTANTVGFMDHPGRKCVALSRARLNFYIVGSVAAFSADWGEVLQRLGDKVGDVLPLVNEAGQEVGVESAQRLFEICTETEKKGVGKTGLE